MRKIAGLWTLYNGLELAEQSILHIEKFFDKIIIAYQTVSNKGNENKSIEDFIKKFTGDKYHFFKYTPDFSVNTKENERRKFSLLLDYAKELDCTHYLYSDCDHFYKESEFEKAMEFSIKGNFATTFTKMYTYYKYPTWQLTPIEDYFCPFISKLSPNTKVINQSHYPAYIDPSRKVFPYCPYYIFSEDEIMMHHYSMIRQNIGDKFANAAASIRWKPEDVQRFISEFESYDLDKNPGISYFKGRKIKVVDNFFSINSF